MRLSEDQVFVLDPLGNEKACYVVRGLANSAGLLGDCVVEAANTDPRCPNEPIHHGPQMTFPKVRTHRLLSKEPVDLMWYPGVVAIRRSRELDLAPSNATGFDFRPIMLFSDKSCRKPVDGYDELRVSGRALVDMGNSGIVEKYRCPICGFVRYSQWRADRGLHFLGPPVVMPDIFMMEPLITLDIFVKGRFAQRLVDGSFRPFSLTHLEDLEPFGI